MRSVLSLFGIYVLALLLAGTFPLGAGDAIHGGALLHPSFPHVHPAASPAAAATGINHPATPTMAASAGPTLDTFGGGAPEAPGLALTPPLPRGAPALLRLGEHRLRGREHPWSAQLAEAPPDPPPSSPAFS